MRNFRRARRLVVLLMLAPPSPASAADPVSVPTKSPKDSAVANAVAEAAATTPGDAMPAADPATATRHAFDILDKSPRQCSVVESAARLAVMATCIRTDHCSTVSVPDHAAKLKPTCYLFKGTTKG